PSRVEGVWAGSYGAKAGSFHAVNDPANGHKCVEIGFKCIAFRKNGVPFCDAERNSVLVKVIAYGDFSAKGVTTSIQRKPSQIVRVCLDQNWHRQSGKFDRIGDALFIAEVRQNNKNAINSL